MKTSRGYSGRIMQSRRTLGYGETKLEVMERKIGLAERGNKLVPHKAVLRKEERRRRGPMWLWRNRVAYYRMCKEYGKWVCS